MPSPWSQAKLGALRRFVSGLRSKRTGPLPVQTGFPTSLADIVVKNRTRLKKRRKPSASPETAFPAPHRDSCYSARSPIAEEPPRPAVDRIGGKVRASTLLAKERKKGGSGLGFLVVKLVLLAALAIGGKPLVIWITGLAFASWLLKLSGVRVLEFFKPCSNARKDLNFMMNGLELKGREMVSPIRQVEISEIRSDSLESVESRNFEGIEKVSETNRGTRSPQIVERKDFDVVGSAFELNREAGTSKNVSAKKKFFRRIFRKKSRGEKSVKDGIGIELSSSEEGEEIVFEEGSRFGVPDSPPNFGIEDLDLIHETPNEVSEFSYEKLDAIEENGIESALDLNNKNDVIKDNVSSKKLGSYRQLVFFVLVLSGLVGGKFAALILTVSCFLVAKLIDIKWRRSNHELVRRCCPLNER